MRPHAISDCGCCPDGTCVSGFNVGTGTWSGEFTVNNGACDQPCRMEGDTDTDSGTYSYFYTNTITSSGALTFSNLSGGSGSVWGSNSTEEMYGQTACTDTTTCSGAYDQFPGGWCNGWVEPPTSCAGPGCESNPIGGGSVIITLANNLIALANEDGPGALWTVSVMAQYEGAFTLSITGVGTTLPVAYDVSAADLQAALVAILPGTTVTSLTPGLWNVVFPSGQILTAHATDGPCKYAIVITLVGDPGGSITVVAATNLSHDEVVGSHDFSLSGSVPSGFDCIPDSTVSASLTVDITA